MIAFAERFGAGLGWVAAHMVEIVSALCAWLAVAAWMAMGQRED